MGQFAKPYYISLLDPKGRQAERTFYPARYNQQDDKYIFEGGDPIVWNAADPWPAQIQEQASIMKESRVPVQIMAQMKSNEFYNLAEFLNSKILSRNSVDRLIEMGNNRVSAFAKYLTKELDIT